jgi:CreA protein
MERIFVSILGITLFLTASSAQSETIGSVDTAFKFLGANHKIVVEAFDDPDINGVVCYLSRAKKGGVAGALGLAEDTSDASITCRQVGPITISTAILTSANQPQTVFKKSTSILFKTMQVVRFYDAKRRALVYLTYSDKLIDGSPKNSISSVPIANWTSR